MTIYRCQCGFAEFAQDRAPFACSACPKCRSNLTEAGVAVGVRSDRMEAADA